MTNNNKLKKILIVEDDKEMITLYKDMFKDRLDVYEIQVENNAESALKRLDDETFDLIILDIIMEPMTGDSFYIFTRLDKKINTPVLVVSVLSPDTLKNLEKIDNISFLQKPINEDQLFEKIESVLK